MSNLDLAAGWEDGYEFGKDEERERIIKLLEEVHGFIDTSWGQQFAAGFAHAIALIKGEEA